MFLESVSIQVSLTDSFFCKVLLTTGIWVGTLAGNVFASESIVDEPVVSESQQTSVVASAEGEFSNLAPASVEISQVTSVSELDDVLPTDWAYTALTLLAEEYGCLEGYPDSTFGGSRAMTRYEFAAGLNACLDVIVELLSDSPHLETIQRLQEDFAAELASIRAQVDSLEADVMTLQDTQFSTTTKLRGRVFTHLTGITAGGDVQAEGISVFSPARDAAGDPVIRTITDDPEVTFSYLTWLNLLTSFTGEDSLNLQLTVGDGVAPANDFASAGLFNTFGTPFTAQQGGNSEDNVILREAFYSFPAGEGFFITVGPKINWYRHFDYNKYTFFVTGANSFNSNGGTQVNAVDRGAGVVVEWDVSDKVEFSLGYLAEATEFVTNASNSSSDASRGLFGGTNTLTAQVEVYPTDDLALRFLYNRTELEANANGFVGGAISEPLYGFADDGFGGPLGGATADTFLFNFDWQPLDWLGLFGRYSYGSTDLQVVTPGLPDGEVNAQSLQLGLAFHDLLKPGSLATISYVRPFDVIDGRDFLISGGGDGSVQEELEVSYRYPVTSNFAIVPSYYWIRNANNFGDNPDIHIFNLQTQFSF